MTAARAAYYNEHDPGAAAWLRELIKAGQIAPGEVDERSIEDVSPIDLRGFRQCHFFAGIGGWSYALRLAGWPDDKPVWTGSCPCQSFSASGKGLGFADERHLWPAFHHLIRECRPPVVFGEQVESAVRHGWLDLVQADMEGEGYGFGAAVLGAHSVGAPHIRQRLYWVAESHRLAGEQGCSLDGGGDSGGDEAAWPGFGGGIGSGGMAYTECAADRREAKPADHQRTEADGPADRVGGRSGSFGAWTDVEWLECRDGKWRPTQSVAQSVVDGVSDDMGYVRLTSYPDRPYEERFALAPLIQKGKARWRLCGYGNAIVPQAAAEFIRAAQG